MGSAAPRAGAADGLRWPPLTRGRLIGRRRRFLADVRLDTGEQVTAHCPNTGSMAGCSEPGRPVYLSRHDDPRRKYPFTWELIRMPGSLVGVNTLLPNRLVHRALAAGGLSEFGPAVEVAREVTVGGRSRLDLCVTGADGRQCFVEIKNCTLVENGTALFPDAVTARGLKHIEALAALAGKGHRAVMFYLVQRMDAVRFRPADHIDPAYGRRLREAAAAGLEILCYDVRLDTRRIWINRRLPCEL